MAKIHGLPSRSIDFVLAFPQADLEVPVYMELPLGFDAPDNESRKLFCPLFEQESLWPKASWIQLVCQAEQWS